MKKLPDLFTNTFNKKIDNNEEYITIKNDNTPLEKPSKYELNKKIDNIFKSNDYIYKIKVNITLKDKEIICTLIGKTNNNLITIENKLINIKDIIDIKKVD